MQELEVFFCVPVLAGDLGQGPGILIEQEHECMPCFKAIEFGVVAVCR